MNKKILWITQSAVLLALLIVLQWVTKPMGQLVTGSCVNAVLAVSTLFVGMGSGMTVALLSPIFAFALNIAPNVVTVPVIMVGNCVFVGVFSALRNGTWRKRILVLVIAAAAKFAVLYGLVQWVICGVAAPALLQLGILKQPMLKALPLSFGVMQLVTALLGGGVTLLIVPVLKKALKKS